MKHYTSKIKTFEDLGAVKTFGFRGEALSSLCALSSSFCIVTATAEQAPMGVKLQYGKDGRLLEQTPTARERGTTVMLQKLFEAMPVRYHEFKRNIKREYAKCLALIQEYSLICNHTRLTCVLLSSKKGSVFALNDAVNLFAMLDDRQFYRRLEGKEC